MRALLRLVRSLLCALGNHDWRLDLDGFGRRCVDCRRFDVRGEHGWEDINAHWKRFA